MSSLEHRDIVPAKQSLVFKEDFHEKAPSSRPGVEWACNGAFFFPPASTQVLTHEMLSSVYYCTAESILVVSALR